MSNPLDNLCGPGKPLHKEAPDANELAGLLRSGTARLKDASNATLALESRFDLAYNAAHSLSLAALRRIGYRAGNRYTVFQVLPHTLGVGPEVWGLRFGGCWTSATTRGTWGSTKVCSMWMNAW